MDCNLVSFSNLHLFEQLRQDDSFSFDRSKIKFIGPTKELIVVATNLLHRSSVIIVLQQGRVFIFCLSDFCLCLRNQPGQHLLREGALPFQTLQYLIFIALLLILGCLDLFDMLPL